VSYEPKSGPVGTTVRIEGNVGQAALDVGGPVETRHVSVRLIKGDDPSGYYRETISEIPYDADGGFRGDAVIPDYLGPSQMPPDTPERRVTPGLYQLVFRPVTGPLDFLVTAD
jgi:hypothetical protein